MKTTFKVLIINFIVNISLVAIKITTGLIGKSASLVADGIHSISDAVTDLIAVVIHLIYSKKRANKEHPYGYGKIEYITSLVLGLILLFIAYELAVSNFTSTPKMPELFVLVIVIITIVMKLVLSYYAYYQGNKINNNLLKALGAESKSDVLASMVILLSIIFSQFGNKYPILKWADYAAVFVVIIFIMRNAFYIIKDNTKALIGQNDYNNKLIKLIYEALADIIKQSDIQSLKIFRYGSYYHLHITISRSPNMTLANIEKINKKIKSQILSIKGIKYIDIDSKIRRGKKYARITRSRNHKKSATKDY